VCWKIVPFLHIHFHFLRNKMEKIACVLALLIATMVSMSSAHSWVGCTSYAEENGRYWDASKCSGYPRNYLAYTNPLFGGDAGYNYQGEGCGQARGSKQFSEMYSAQYPMAKYSPGQRVCLAWPAKNHVAETCTNQYIPDGGIHVFYSGPNPTSDPTQAQLNQNEILPFGNGKHVDGQIDFKGFQNCPAFCENMDKSLCTGCFTLPNLAPGIYTFQWYWIFNPGTPYTNCFDVEILAGDSATTAPNLPITTPATTSLPAAATTASPPVPITDTPATTYTYPITQSVPTTSQGTTSVSTKDSVQPDKLPVKIPSTGSFVATVQYNSNGERTIVVEVQDVSGASYGKGKSNVPAGSGSVPISVFITSDIPKGKGYKLVVWIVDRAVYENPAYSAPWVYQLDRLEWGVEVGDSVAYAGDPQTPSTMSGASSNVASALLLWLVAMLGVMVYIS
jgi:hypothetical protein